MRWIKTPWADAGDKLVELIFKLEGTIYLEAHSSIFPGKCVNEAVVGQYEILGDLINRDLMVVLYQNGNLDINNLAEKLSLPIEDVQRRIEFFKANGLRRDVAKKYI